MVFVGVIALWGYGGFCGLCLLVCGWRVGFVLVLVVAGWLWSGLLAVGCLWLQGICDCACMFGCVFVVWWVCFVGSCGVLTWR